jgi:hypothetical protein
MISRELGMGSVVESFKLLTRNLTAYKRKIDQREIEAFPD